MKKIIDMTGSKIGGLTVLKLIGRRHGRALWLCKCAYCSQEKEMTSDSLRSGGSKSCGCRSLLTRYPESKTDRSLYGIWRGMMKRCRNKNLSCYRHYGGRGIDVCDRWSSYAYFRVDMSPRPPGSTLERIDNNKGYSADNCRWATMREQCKNKRTNKYVTIGKQTKIISDWLRDPSSLVSYETAKSRVRSGWSVLRAISTPKKGTAPGSAGAVAGGGRDQSAAPCGPPS